MYAEKCTDQRRTGVPLHNHDSKSQQIQGRENVTKDTESDSTGNDGTWGERDIGGPVDLRAAMQDYDDMRRELTQLSRSRSQLTQKTTRIQSRLQRALFIHSKYAASRTASEAATDVETRREEDEEDFELGDFLRDGHFEKRTDGRSAKKVGVVFRNLTVQGVGATATFVKTLPSAVAGTFGLDLYKILARVIPCLPAPGARGEKRDLIHDFTGVVRNGEMLLVLGRPGSGCSTFLKAITNKREEFAAVTGDVYYGGISATEQKKKYRGEVNYNEEDDQHLPTLTVEQTLEFSLLNKTRKREKGDIPVIISALLKMFGISHTKHTLVGDGKTSNATIQLNSLTAQQRLSAEYQEVNENGCLLPRLWLLSPQSWHGITAHVGWTLLRPLTTPILFE